MTRAKAVLGLLLIALFSVVSPSVASAAVPTDPRIKAAVAAWKTSELYVDPAYAPLVGEDEAKLVERIRGASVPVYVAVLPSGAWYQEKGDTALLAGWLATANERPGIYLVMDGITTTGVDHLIAASGPRRTYMSDSEDGLVPQLEEYLGEIKTGERYEPEPARTTPLPPPVERSYPEEKFTPKKAIGNGVGGGVIGLIGGAVLAGIVLGVASLVARRGGR
ncbi:hypothetical protein FB561_1401 [Kribbella amoyensis]|uniref:TPM domain-containing protein n=1 Tax=Kribbella amoyensis TaxID=996641 RepID=A0A561BN95_9ACTN|nr:hypothetical protein [Kribbella amoyensis]TWD80327.1 hypothetical protein FB561_1401 [Kribbella amoyensis]